MTQRQRVPWARLAVVGAIAGFASGLFGVGGGIVIVPGLVMVAGFPHKLATGTSLTSIVPIAVAGLVGYAADGAVDWAAAACVVIGAIAGAILGTRLLVRISGPLLQILFALAMVVTALRMFAGEGTVSGRADLSVGVVLGLVALGLLSGLLAGLLGVGGGIVIVPALSIAFGLPHVLAKGTSLAVIAPTAVIGTIRNRRTQLTAIRPGVAVGLAGIVSALAASRLSLELDPDVSRWLFAALLLLVAARLALAGWADWRTPTA